MSARLSRTTALLVAVTAAVIAGALTWPRTAASDGTTVLAPSPTVSSTIGAPPTGLDRGLLNAIDAAIVAADEAGHDLTVTSGFRTVAEQEALLAEAVAERGLDEALRWVFPPERSMHVRGLAVDVGDGPAAEWLDEHGARFGLCRTLAWEWWHFEWRAAWEASSTCPRPADDPAEAPA